MLERPNCKNVGLQLTVQRETLSPVRDKSRKEYPTGSGQGFCLISKSPEETLRPPTINLHPYKL